MRFALVLAEKAHHDVKRLCGVLGVTRSGYYAWRKRSPSLRAERERRLRRRIRVLHAQNRGVYGSPRLAWELRASGEAVSRHCVARLMRAEGLAGRQRRRFRRTTDSAHALAVAANLLGRRFRAPGPDRVWVADLSYVRTWEGWLYLAVVVDLYSRRVVGWAAASHMRTELVLEALGRALALRRPGPGLLHHSDRGSQYASHAYRRELERHGITMSMSRKGNCWDNAVAESFFATIKEELIHRGSWPTRAKAHAAIGDYIDGFYNPRRRHSTLSYLSPINFEIACRRGENVT